MRAGKLDRTIQIQRFTNTVDDFGTPVMAWDAVATLRAQLIEANTEEYLRGNGATDETAAVFRTRYLDGVGTADRVSYQGGFFNIRDVKELGRRDGLEIRCEKATNS